MNLLTHSSASLNLSLADRALLNCREAKQLEDAGEYEQAREALREFWPERNEPPSVEGLDPATKAEVLLRVGALTGWLGSANQSNGTQETAKNLITRSIESFQGLGKSERVAEARTDLALCYWREGGFDEARVVLNEVISDLGDSESEVKALALVRSAIVEMTAGRYAESWNIYRQARPLVEATDHHALKGKFYNGLATLLNCMGLDEERDDYIDQSLIEYAAASFHFEQAGHTRYQGCVENNLGFLFCTLGRFAEAHGHLDRARSLFLQINDQVHLGQMNDTRARTFLAQGRLQEAEKFAQLAVKTLEKGGEQSLLAGALTTCGIAEARSGHYARSKTLLERAVEVAETAGDPEGAGRARLSIIEELTAQTSATEIASIYKSAADLLRRSQCPSSGKRLISCARKAIDALAAPEEQDWESTEHSWQGFSFKQEVIKCEKVWIERALRHTGGAVTRAALLLGFRHHQSLISIINNRHKDLLKTRSAVRKRRQHIFSKPAKSKKDPKKDSRESVAT